MSNEKIAKTIIKELENRNAGLDTIKMFVRIAMAVGGLDAKDGTEICRMVVEGLPFCPLEEVW